MVRRMSGTPRVRGRRMSNTRKRSAASKRISDAEAGGAESSGDDGSTPPARRASRVGLGGAKGGRRSSRVRICVVLLAATSMILASALLFASSPTSPPTAAAAQAEGAGAGEGGAAGADAHNAWQQPLETQEPRFARELRPGEARRALERLVGAASSWFDARGYDHFLVGAALRAAHQGGGEERAGGAGVEEEEEEEQEVVVVGGGVPACTIAMRSASFAELAAVLSRQAHENPPWEWTRATFPGGAIQDQPWDTRSRLFPAYHAELWASLDTAREAQPGEAWAREQQGDEEDGGGRASGMGRGVGLLNRPNAPCAPYRMVDADTGVFCDVVRLEQDGGAASASWGNSPGSGLGGGGAMALRMPGGPHKCQAEAGDRECGLTTCFHLIPTDVEPTESCKLFGAQCRCPHDSRAVLASFYQEFRAALI
jgi:hypothetical protein